LTVSRREDRRNRREGREESCEGERRHAFLDYGVRGTKSSSWINVFVSVGMVKHIWDPWLGRSLFGPFVKS
jgi:hypothetical protein